jgi:CelD/BcsL family acetyltransferase involved in cellulose biosynthesis
VFLRLWTALTVVVLHAGHVDLHVPRMTEVKTTRFRVQTLHGLTDMIPVEAAWRALELTCAGQMVWFQSYDWCHTWLSVHTDMGFRPHIVLLYDSAKLVVVWPMMVIRGPGGLGILTALGEPHTQYANVLADGNKLGPEAIACLRDAVMDVTGVDTVLANFVPDGSLLTQVMPSGSHLAELSNTTSQLHFTEFATGQEFRGNGRKSKKNWYRAEKILKHLGKISMEVLRPGDADYDSLIKKAVAEKEDWLKRTGRISRGLRMADHSVFLARLPASATGPDGPYLFVLRAGPQPFAFEVGFLQHGHYYRYLGSFDWTYHEASPGKLQIDMTVAWLIDNGGKVFDLMGNPTDYKKRLSNVEISLHSYAVPVTMQGRVFVRLWIRLLKPALKSIYHSGREYFTKLRRPAKAAKAD